MKRRHFLAVAGGGVILAASGFTLTRTPTKALAPWQDAGVRYTEPRRKALSYALLAPNPHNRQPWLVDLSTPSVVKIFADLNRLLPATDPYSRQITIGLGCFLELLRMAGAEDGYRVDIEQFPDGADSDALDKRAIAIASFSADKSVSNDPLFAHVLQRRSLKEPYDSQRPVADDVLTRLRATVGEGVTGSATNVDDEVLRLREVTHEAFAIELETPHTYKESVDLFRIGKAEIETNPDGIDFSGMKFETLHALGQFNREIALDTTSNAYQQGIKSVMANVDTAMAHAWLITPSNTRIDQLNAGRDWLRMNLAATALGVGIQPLSQALQEYPEMAPYYTRIHRQLAPNGGTVQMLARLGYGADVPPSPRWPLEKKLLRA